MSFPGSPYEVYQSPTRRRTSQSSVLLRDPPAPVAESEESSDDTSSDDEVQILKVAPVAEHQSPVQRRTVSGTRGTRKRPSH